MDQDSKYTILFKSLEVFREDEKNNNIYQIIEQSNLIKDQYDYLKQFCVSDEVTENIGFTRT